jgi:hypothetical protein
VGRAAVRRRATPICSGRPAGREWRRALVTSAQLSSYYIGHTEVADLADNLRASADGERAVNDRMLAHGSPPGRLLRTLFIG